MESLRLKGRSWFLYMVGVDCDILNLNSRTWGVGSCNYDPGIVDAPYGKMLIAPGEYVAEYFYDVRSIKSITPQQLRECIALYYSGEKN